MTTETAAPAGGELEPAPVVGLPNLFEASGDDYSPEQAARDYEAKQNAPAESADDATAEKSEAKAEDAAPEGTTAEDAEGEPELPAIDPPKSWSKEAHERWSKLDRETQEFLAARDSEDQKAIKRSLQEAAEARKAAEAERLQAGELNKALAAKLPEMESAVQEYLSHKYPEFKTMDDVVQMARQADALAEADPFTALKLGNRVKAWEIDQQRIAHQLNAARVAAQNLAKEKQSEWTKFVHEESKAFADEVPEFKAKEAEYSKKAGDVLRELGFTDEQLTKLVSGEEKIALFDRRMQRLLFDRIRLSEIQAAPPKAIPKPVPAVQKPGVVAPRGAQAAENVQALRNKLSGSGSVEDAFALYQAKQRRRSS